MGNYFFKKLFYVGVCLHLPMCTLFFLPGAHRVRRGHWPPWNWSCRQPWTMWVLGTEPGLSKRAMGAFTLTQLFRLKLYLETQTHMPQAVFEHVISFPASTSSTCWVICVRQLSALCSLLLCVCVMCTSVYACLYVCKGVTSVFLDHSHFYIIYLLVSWGRAFHWNWSLLTSG